MNTVDTLFYEITTKIKTKTKEEIFYDIQTTYNNLNDNIKESLENYFATFDYWGPLHGKNGTYDEIKNRTNSLHDHIEDIIWLYEHLQDYRSKKVLLAIIANYYNYNFTILQECRETNFPPYFDIDIVKCNKEEVIIDLGAYTGDTVLDYIKTYGINAYKKIYCYEITEDTFTILKNNLSYYKNIECRKKAISDSKVSLYINENSIDQSANTLSEYGNKEIEATTIDLDLDEKITMIKMDIEGMEQKALIGCTKTIQKYRPKLLISVYHNHEDIWKIPKMIEEIQPGYNFYLRYYGNNIFPTETTLIAIYKK